MKLEVKVYTNDEHVADINMTKEQFDLYIQRAQQPEGVILLGDLEKVLNKIITIEWGIETPVYVI